MSKAVEARDQGAGAQGRPAYGCESKRQRRKTIARFAATGLCGLCRECRHAGYCRYRRHACVGAVSSRRGPHECGATNFRVFGPDETVSTVWTRYSKLRIVSGKPRPCRTTNFAHTGQVMEMLSEHQCEGWLEGYLLTGRHGLFNCYEAFIHIVDSMFNQHAKWLKVSAGLPWRSSRSLNYLLSSHVWRQDHNGFTTKTRAFWITSSTKRRKSSACTTSRRELPLVRHGSLSAQQALRQRRRGRQTSRTPMAVYGCCRQTLHRRGRNLAVGQ